MTEPPELAEPIQHTEQLPQAARSHAIAIGIGAIVVLLVLVAGAWAMWASSRGVSGEAVAARDTQTSGTSSAGGSVALPAGAVPCPAIMGRTADLTKSARGNDVTSCPFAEETRIAYARGGASSSAERAIEVYSPVTKKRYSMSCRKTGPGTLVTCAGGNDAVVYLY